MDQRHFGHDFIVLVYCYLNLFLILMNMILAQMNLIEDFLVHPCLCRFTLFVCHFIQVVDFESTNSLGNWNFILWHLVKGCFAILLGHRGV